MRSAIFGAVALTATAIFLSACSGTSHDQTAVIPAAGPDVKPAAIARKLYVTDASDNDVAVLRYLRWRNIGSIADGIDGPAGNWVDRSGNLYVANTRNAGVTEYDSSGTLIYTYTAGLTQPNAVTTDRFGVVYVADGFGSVNEYSQQNNYVAATCAPGNQLAPVGVALDKRGDVFVAYVNVHSGIGNIIEYPRGLIRSRCNGTVLPMTFEQINSLVVDPNGNLVVAVSGAAVVDVIAPPYSHVTGTLGSGWTRPAAVTIDKAGTQAYVTDNGTATVSVVTYPGGSVVATLGSANGLSNPMSAVDSKNFVP